MAVVVEVVRVVAPEMLQEVGSATLSFCCSPVQNPLSSDSCPLLPSQNDMKTASRRTVSITFGEPRLR